MKDKLAVVLMILFVVMTVFGCTIKNQTNRKTESDNTVTVEREVLKD